MSDGFRDDHGRKTMDYILVVNLIIERYDEIDGGYQRKPPTAKWLAARSGKNFNQDRLRPLEVADLSHEGQPGIYAVIDGQGRLALLQEQNVERALCRIHYGTTKPQRARLFCGLDDVRKLKYVDTFRAQIAGGDPTANKIQNILRKSGFNLRSHSQGAVTGFSTVKHVFDALGGDVLSSAVKVFGESWLEEGVLDKRALPGQYVAGMSKIVEHLDGSFRKVEPAIKKVLGKHGPSEIKTRIYEDAGGKKIRTDQVPTAFALIVGRLTNAATKKERDKIPLIDLGALREIGDGKNF